MTATKLQKQEKAEALGRLADLLEPGDTLYTVLRHVSSSGMNRWIDVYVIRENEPIWLSRLIAMADGAGYWDDKRECLRVPGAGMDMGFHVVNTLSSQLYREPDGGYSHDGSYALNHRWM